MFHPVMVIGSPLHGLVVGKWAVFVTSRALWLDMLWDTLALSGGSAGGSGAAPLGGRWPMCSGVGLLGCWF